MSTTIDRTLSLDEALALANDHHQAGRFADALAIYQAVLERAPDCAPAQINMGALLLLHGNFADGWPAFAWRRHGQQGQLAVWNGRPLDGRGILIRGEQGAGDNIQFLRYVADVESLGGRPVVLTLPGMKRLFAGLAGGAHIVEPGDQVSDLACEVPVMDLPGLLGTTAETIPAEVPYLSAEPALVAEWRERLGPARGPRIGLCWQGNPDKPRDHLRSIPLARFEALFGLAGSHWFGLQVGPGEDQAAAFADHQSFTHLGAALGESPDKFVDTAAVIANLDLVISVDTAIAHLAGAMAKPVWVLLPFVPDWRWMLERTDSPWYPTARLFRQPAPGDWDTPLGQLAAAMETMPNS